MIHESNANDGNEPPQLVGHNEHDYYNKSESDSSDDDSDNKDKDNNFYDGPDPGVSGIVLETRQQMIYNRQQVRFKDHNHKMLMQEEQLTVEQI